MIQSDRLGRFGRRDFCLASMALGVAGPIATQLAFSRPAHSQTAHNVMIGSRLTPGYDMGVNSGKQRFDWVQAHAGEMQADYPADQGWGAIFVTVGRPKNPPRPSRDLSSYSELRVEMKGESGGEPAWVAIKDNEQPDDGSETQIPVKLSGDWESYVFPLSAFVGADLQKIYSPFLLIFHGDRAISVRFRNVFYA